MKVLLVGESCFDMYFYGDCLRINPEAPSLILNQKECIESEGMSSNVLKNILAINNTLEIVHITNEKKGKKIRYVDAKSNYTLLRVDIDDSIARANISDILKTGDVLVISDYDKGYLSELQIELLLSTYELSFLDTKKKLGKWCDNATFIKINEDEYNRNAIGYKHPHLIVTKGAKGATLNGIDYPSEEVNSLYDVAGAGDSFFAGLICEYLKTKDIHQSIKYANKIAGIVVQKRGVSTI